MENQYRSIYDLLQQLGVTANYTGYFHAAYAVQLCMKRPERLLLVTKLVYPDVAKQFQTTWRAVERNIRTVGGTHMEAGALSPGTAGGKEAVIQTLCRAAAGYAHLCYVLTT